MSLTINDVRRISDLARIDLSEESAKKLMGELNDILSMVEQIQSVDTTGVAPMPHPFGGVQRLRPDDVRAQSPRGKYAERSRRNGRFILSTESHRIT